MCINTDADTDTDTDKEANMDTGWTGFYKSLGGREEEKKGGRLGGPSFGTQVA